jgi:type I restriction enzyme S subunit
MPMVLPPASVRSVFDNLIEPILKRLPETYFENRSLSEMRELLLPKLMSGELHIDNAKSLIEKHLDSEVA